MPIICNKSHNSCIEVRRYAVVALTNMTFGKANIKSFLCTSPDFITLMVKQLQCHSEVNHELPSRLHRYSLQQNVTPSSAIENLRKATAHLFRNLAWKADKKSRQLLSDSEVVSVLLRSAMDVSIAAIEVSEGGKPLDYKDISTYKSLPKEVEPLLKVILSALWNLSAHCRKNKVRKKLDFRCRATKYIRFP